MRKTAAVLIVGVLLGPVMLLLGMSVLVNPAADASCLPTINASTSPATPPASAPAETARVVIPLPSGTWIRTSGFGIRVHPITGETTLHTGVDFAAAAGTPILAAADGRVAFAGPATGYGNLILITHTVNGQVVASGYAHMEAANIYVKVDDPVNAGQHIADVGTAGYSTGPHLHFEIRPGGASNPPVDPEPWLSTQGAATVVATTAGSGACATEAAPPGPNTGNNPGQMVDDPTSAGQITERTAYILSQVRARFPNNAWSCWSERPGDDSEHEIGRACDGTFGNSIGTAAAGASLEFGWAVTNWLKDHAETLGVEYLIWQGRIWSVAHASEGWRPYDGGGMHDPTSVTGGHFDHCHFTAAP